MKKYIVLLIGTCLSILCSAQNHHAIQVYHGSDVHSYSFAEIDSIAHDRESFIRIYGNHGKVTTYSIEEVDSISIRPDYLKFYKIDDNCLEGWDEGIIADNTLNHELSIYVVEKFDSLRSIYTVHFNRLSQGKAEYGITFYINLEKQIERMMVNNYCYTAISEDDPTSFVGFFENGVFPLVYEDEVDSWGWNLPLSQQGKEAPGAWGVITTALNTYDIGWLLDYLGKREIGEFALSIGSLEIESLMDVLKIPAGKRVVGTALVEALLRPYQNRMKSGFYNDCVPQITEITKDNISVRINGIENLQDFYPQVFASVGTSKKVNLVVLISDKANDMTYSKCKYKTSQIQLDKNTSTVNLSVPIDMTSGTYYLRPMLITDQVLEKQFDIAREWYVQYGDIRMYNYPKVTIGNITTNSCHYHDSSSEYSVDVTIDATIETLQGVSLWGVGVYSSNGELLKEISTTSDNAAYSFRYQDILPASSLDSTSHTIKLRAVPFTVRKTQNDKAYGEAKDFEVKKDLCPDDNHPHMIDLGIGAKWACCNVGAHEPEDYGGYYAWGETAEKDDYSKENYLFYSRENISGTQYDAARVNWGAPWRMPSEAEWRAFYRNCSSEWTTVNGIYGRRFTGPNGNSIFLPAAGYREDGNLIRRGRDGCYWSGPIYSEDWWYVWKLSFTDGKTDWYFHHRTHGLSVRPVSE